jgi:2-oxoisovalerate ferredoxin oxidoreductase beta subunit
MKARKAIRKALKNQVENRGYSFVEILSVCPTGWKMDSPDARDWLTDQMIEAFPLGVYKDESSEREDSWYRGIKPFVPSELNKYFGVNAEADVVPVDLKKDLFCKFAGFGGQGILTMGLFLAQIGMRADHHVSWIPAYGPEMRGGTANCSVNVSSNRIGTPLVERPNVMVAMNLPSLEMFEKDVVDGGVILVDSGIVDKTPDTDRLDVVMIPATKIADEVGTPKVANVVMLGAMIAATDAYSMDFVSDTLKIVVKKKNLIDMNLAALQRGYDFVKNGS